MIKIVFTEKLSVFISYSVWVLNKNIRNRIRQHLLSLLMILTIIVWLELVVEYEISVLRKVNYCVIESVIISFCHKTCQRSTRDLFVCVSCFSVWILLNKNVETHIRQHLVY
jgi:hypothetical protein